MAESNPFLKKLRANLDVKAHFGWLQHRGIYLKPLQNKQDIHHPREPQPIPDATPSVASMALLLTSGSMSSNTKGEGEIRCGNVKADLVECMVALLGKLFTNTQIPACIWFLTKTKQKRGPILSPSLGEGRGGGTTTRGGEAEQLGYEGIPGFCKSATLDEITEHGYVLTPGRYVGAEEVEDDGIPFADKMATLTSDLADQFAESAKLKKTIRKNMKALGFELPVGGGK